MRFVSKASGTRLRRWLAALITGAIPGCGTPPASTSAPPTPIERPAGPAPASDVPVRELVVLERGELILHEVTGAIFVESAGSLARVGAGGLTDGDRLGRGLPRAGIRSLSFAAIAGSWPAPLFAIVHRPTDEPGYGYDLALYRWDDAGPRWRPLGSMGEPKSVIDVEPLGTDRWIGQRFPIAPISEPDFFILGPDDQPAWLELGRACVQADSFGGHSSGHVYAACKADVGQGAWLQHWTPGTRRATAYALDRPARHIAARSPDDVLLLDDGRPRRFDGRSVRDVEGGPTGLIEEVVLDGDDLWLFERGDPPSPNRLWHWPKGVPAARVDLPLEVVALHAARDGVVWLAAPTGLVRREADGTLTSFRVAGYDDHRVGDVVATAPADALAIVSTPDLNALVRAH
jgi:hypothetical protein